jgi:hypothetical protein
MVTHMPSDPGYRTMCPPADPVATQKLPPPVVTVPVLARAPGLWTGDQISFLAIHLAIIASFVVGMLVFSQDFLRMVWTPSQRTGIKPMTGGGLVILFNAGLYLLLCAVLNRYFPPNQKDPCSRATLFGLVAAFQLLIFLYFAFWVLMAGYLYHYEYGY